MSLIRTSSRIRSLFSCTCTRSSSISQKCHIEDIVTATISMLILGSESLPFGTTSSTLTFMRYSKCSSTIVFIHFLDFCRLCTVLSHKCHSPVPYALYLGCSMVSCSEVVSAVCIYMKDVGIDDVCFPSDHLNVSIHSFRFISILLSVDSFIPSFVH